MYKTSYGGVLAAYESRIETTELPFLTQDPQEVEIHFRDWDDQTRSMYLAFESVFHTLISPQLSLITKSLAKVP